MRISDWSSDVCSSDLQVMTVAEGNGPVNALDFALRKALEPAWPALVGVRLTDYKVRILTPGDCTAALTRVMIESADPAGERWTTVGVPGNIINASYEAVHDASVHRLFRTTGAAGTVGPTGLKGGARAQRRGRRPPRRPTHAG